MINFYRIISVVLSVVILLNLSNNIVSAASQCYQCADRANCIQESSGFTTVQCNSASTDSCVTIYDNFTPIKRDCYSSLGDEEKISCDADGDLTCSKCTDDNCNRLGREDHKCHVCSTTNDTTCLDNPAASTLVRCPAPLYDGTPMCSVSADGIVTKRGCIVSSDELSYCTNETNSRSCSGCEVTSTGCNNNVFPSDRRKCYKCSEDNCYSATQVSGYCSDPDDGCVETFIFGAKRACYLDTTAQDHNLCDTYPERCVQCLADECNLNLIPPVDCLNCTESENSACTFDTDTIGTIQCQEGCASYLSSDTMTHRTCFEDLPISLLDDCSGTTCRKCGENKCNADPVPENRLTCFKCEDGEVCGVANRTAFCTKYVEGDECVALLWSGKVTKLSCQSELTTAQTDLCDSSLHCQKSTCAGSNCNDPSLLQTPLSCVQCNSLTERLCTTSPDTLPALPCSASASGDFCYTAVVNGQNERGCFSSLTEKDQQSCAMSMDCDVCAIENGCNSKIFPYNRRYCHQCDSKSNPNCAKLNSTPSSVCEEYASDAMCYSIVKSDGAILRTCAPSKSTICDGTLKCDACKVDGCNSAEITTGGGDSGGAEGIVLNMGIFLINLLIMTRSL